jgi:pSer/pThr/pTyr-binding forkhead associated (FHA) protein
MANVVLLAGGEEIERFPVPVGRILIGRTPNADIHLGDTTVSVKHAVIEGLGELEDAVEVYLQDLGSTNGTLLNGSPVRRQPLHDGDQIGIGRHQLRFLLD